MNPAPFALVFVFAFLGLFSPHEAKADVTAACYAHIAGKNTTPSGDARYHLLHGGESPCAGSDNSTSEASRDDSGSRSTYGRDSFGIHCTWRGCG